MIKVFKRLCKSIGLALLLVLFCAITSILIGSVLGIIGWGLSLLISADGTLITFILLFIIFFIGLIVQIYREDM